MDCFACIVHRLDRFLETCCRAFCAELTGGIHNYPYAFCHSYPIDTGDKCILVSYSANSDLARIAGNTWVAHLDIVTARREIYAGRLAQCDIAAAGSVKSERTSAVRRVGTAGRVASERIRSVVRVA